MGGFYRGNPDGKHYWLTPPDLLGRLSMEFMLTFDACPYPVPEGFDGLTCEWGQNTYVNPPFGSIVHDGKKKGPTAWARKAIAEFKKGKRVIMVYPIDKWVLMLLQHATEVRNLGDVKWVSIEDGQPGPGIGRHVACFVLDPSKSSRASIRKGVEMTVKNSVYESAVKGRQDFRAALVKERDKVKTLRAVLESVKAGLGDRLLADGPLSDNYAHGLMKDIDTALKQTC